MITVTAAVIEFRGKILAARKRSGLHLSGFWEFPGGKVEPGESPEESLARELKEELGISCRVESFLGESAYHYSDKSIRLLGYYATPLSTSITLTDHDEIRWLAPENLYSVDWAPADLPLVDMVFAQAVNDKTLSYYEENAERYVRETLHIDMEDIRERFIEHLPDQGRVLDLGCGSGRDSKAFLERGFTVKAVDASPAVAEQAGRFLEQEVSIQRAQDLEETSLYDGVWACASLLHVPESEFSETLARIIRSLKLKGTLYISMKILTSGSWDLQGRYFNRLSEREIRSRIMEAWPTAHLETFITSSRKSEGQNTWLNILMQKTPP